MTKNETAQSSRVMRSCGGRDTVIASMVDQINVLEIAFKIAMCLKDNYTINKTKAQIVPSSILYLNPSPTTAKC